MLKQSRTGRRDCKTVSFVLECRSELHTVMLRPCPQGNVGRGFVLWRNLGLLNSSFLVFEAVSLESMQKKCYQLTSHQFSQPVFDLPGRDFLFLSFDVVLSPSSSLHVCPCPSLVLSFFLTEYLALCLCQSYLDLSDFVFKASRGERRTGRKGPELNPISVFFFSSCLALFWSCGSCVGVV